VAPFLIVAAAALASIPAVGADGSAVVRLWLGKQAKEGKQYSEACAGGVVVGLWPAIIRCQSCVGLGRIYLSIMRGLSTLLDGNICGTVGMACIGVLFEPLK